MNYKQLVKDAWQTTWKNKWLWWIAFCAGVPFLQINTLGILELHRPFVHFLRTAKGIQADLFILLLYGGWPIFHLFHKFLLVLAIDKSFEGGRPVYGRLWFETFKKMFTVVLFAGIMAGLLILWSSVFIYSRILEDELVFFLYNFTACFLFFLLSQLVYVMLIERVGVLKAVIQTWKFVFTQNFKVYAFLSIILSGIATTFLSLSTQLSFFLKEFGESWMLFIPWPDGRQSPFIVDFLLLLSVILIFLLTSILLTWVNAVWIHTYKTLQQDGEQKL